MASGFGLSSAVFTAIWAVTSDLSNKNSKSENFLMWCGVLIGGGVPENTSQLFPSSYLSSFSFLACCSVCLCGLPVMKLQPHNNPQKSQKSTSTTTKQQQEYEEVASSPLSSSLVDDDDDNDDFPSPSVTDDKSVLCVFFFTLSLFLSLSHTTYTIFSYTTHTIFSCTEVCCVIKIFIYFFSLF